MVLAPFLMKSQYGGKRNEVKEYRHKNHPCWYKGSYA